MLIGLCGGICAGKKTIAQYLVDHHGFTRLYLQSNEQAQLNGTTSNSPSIKFEDDQQEEERKEESTITTPQENGLPSRSKPTPTSHTFPTPDELLDFVTKRWRERWVTTDIHNENILDKLLRRPFFILISVDAPISTRYQRHLHRAPNSQTTLETFLLRSDAHLYDPHHGLQSLISRATIRLLNTSSNLAHLYATLGKLDLTNEDRLRPSWDQYFMSLASLAALRSNCMKRRVGCVVVRDKRVISTGYNGTPRHLTNCSEGGCARCNSGSSSGVGLGTCLCLHAEENALLEAGRDRIGGKAILYCDTCPCLTCSIKIVQVGVGEVVYAQGYSMDLETEKVFSGAGVKLRQFVPPANGLIHLEK